MRRREFIKAAFASAAGLPFAAQAQQVQNVRVPVIGYLSSKDQTAEAAIIAGVSKGLTTQGFTVGQNVVLEYRWSAGNYEQLPRLASELVANKVDVIAASGLPAALAAKAATSSIPIIFRLAIDPVAFDLVKSFDKPGGHITGVTMLFDPLTPKKLELLHDMIPGASVALLVNQKNPNNVSHKEHAEIAAKKLGVNLTVLKASTDGEIASAFDEARQDRIGAVLIGDDPLFDVQSAHLVAAAARSKIPTMFYVRDFVTAGGLISYGPRFDEMAFQVGTYAGRILKGEKAADLPVQQPTKFELVINLKTAKSLGLTIPQSLLTAADEVIE